MPIERSSPRQAALESSSMNSITAENLLASLKTSREYREAFVDEAIRSRITAQIAALRAREGGDYKTFAEKLGKKVAWAYRLEDPNMPLPTISSLLEVAAACDIGVDVRFCRFSDLIRDVSSLNSEAFSIPSFEEELKTASLWRGRSFRHIRSNRHRPRQKPKKKLGFKECLDTKGFGQYGQSIQCAA